jgi:hypothetical protein
MPFEMNPVKGHVSSLSVSVRAAKDEDDHSVQHLSILFGFLFSDVVP